MCACVLCVVQNEALKERQKNFFCAKCGVLVAGYDRHAVLDGDPFRCSPLCFDDTHTLHYTRIRYHMFQHSTVCVLSYDGLRHFFALLTGDNGHIVDSTYSIDATNALYVALHAMKLRRLSMSSNTAKDALC